MNQVFRVLYFSFRLNLLYIEDIFQKRDSLWKQARGNLREQYTQKRNKRTK